MQQRTGDKYFQKHNSPDTQLFDISTSKTREYKNHLQKQ